jgi:hypothetical protein
VGNSFGGALALALTLVEMGRRGMVGGQKDMIEDTARAGQGAALK